LGIKDGIVKFGGKGDWKIKNANWCVIPEIKYLAHYKPFPQPFIYQNGVYEDDAHGHGVYREESVA